MKNFTWLYWTALACLAAYWAIGDIGGHRWWYTAVGSALVVLWTILGQSSWEEVRRRDG